MPLNNICCCGLEGQTFDVFSMCLFSTAIPPVSRELERCVSPEIKTQTGVSGIS